MPLLSYNCLNELNLYLMHLVRFQRTWSYPANQGRPHPGYQAMSTIKGTLRYSRIGGEGEWGFTGRFQRFKRYILRALRAQQGRGKKRGTKQERAKEWEFVPYHWDHSKNHLASKETYAKTCTHQISLSPTKILLNLSILEGNAQAKPLELEFQNPQVLCKSTKSVRIGAKILVADSFSWNSSTYMYMY